MGEGALQVLITLAGGVNTFVMCWNMAMALPMRGRTAYLVASGAAMAFDLVTGEAYPAVARIHFLLCMFILPPFLMRGPAARRLVATALCIGVAIAGEGTGVLFLTLVGKPLDAAAVIAEDPVLFLVLRLLTLAVLVACGRLVRALGAGCAAAGAPRANGAGACGGPAGSRTLCSRIHPYRRCVGVRRCGGRT